MTPDNLALAFILTSSVLTAVVNALMKSAGDILVNRAICLVTSSTLMVPVTLFVPSPGPELWLWLFLAAGVHLIYHFLLVNAYRFGDLSAVFPVARGIVPLLTACGAMVFLAEPLRAWQVFGAVAVTGGVVAFALEKGGSPAARTGYIFAVAIGLLITTYTLIDASVIRRAANPLTVVAWFFVLDMISLPTVTAIKRWGRLAAVLKAEWKRGVITGVFSLFSFGLTLLALYYGATAEIAALRETSVIFAAAIGAVLFGEAFGKRRILAAVIIALGAVVVRLG